MSIEITSNVGAARIDVKRLYLPGLVLRQTCPECNHVRIRDYSKDSYLGYPMANEPFELPCWCPECNHEWTVGVQLNVNFIGFSAPEAQR